MKSASSASPSRPVSAISCSLHFRDKETARACDAHLQENGIVARRMDGYHIPQALRLSVGTEEANHAVIAALKSFKP